MGEQSQTPDHQMPQQLNSTPAEIRWKVAAYRAYKIEAGRRRRGYLRVGILLAFLSLAAPLLIRHRHGLAHGCRSWLTHAHRRHHHSHSRPV